VLAESMLASEALPSMHRAVRKRNPVGVLLPLEVLRRPLAEAMSVPVDFPQLSAVRLH